MVHPDFILKQKKHNKLNNYKVNLLQLYKKSVRLPYNSEVDVISQFLKPRVEVRLIQNREGGSLESHRFFFFFLTTFDSFLLSLQLNLIIINVSMKLFLFEQFL